MAHQLPDMPDLKPIPFQEVLAVTEKLNLLLLQETALLAQMKMKELAPLQAEKLSLSAKLESYHRALAGGSPLAGNEDPAARDKLLLLANGLATTIQENMRLTSLAQTVNRRVMQTFVDQIAEQQRVHVYGKKGTEAAPVPFTVSVNINERA